MWLRLRQIALVAHKLAPVIDSFKEVFGLEVCFRDPGVKVFGLENALTPVGSQFLEVVAPIQENTAGGRYLERRKGDGGYMVILQCDDHAPVKKRVADLGIRKALEQDEPEYCIMQLLPKDTGGSFLEIDYQRGGEAPDGPWSPAGRNWKPAVRTDVVRAVTAAEIQTPNVAALSERWGKILGLPVQPDSKGRPSIRLSNANIRFVKDEDGRGEGLGGVDLEVVNPGKLKEAAARRGLNTDNNVVLIGGVRFGLISV